MGKTRYIAVPAELETAVTDLIQRNREELIKATIPEAGARDQLLDLNRKIQELGDRDPDLVGAWGLGCGAGCITDIALAQEAPFRR